MIKLTWLIAYIASIALVNVAFTYLPHISLGDHGILPAATFLVGLIFIIRDYAQRSAGHIVLAAMAVGIAISYVMADPMVAIASGAAFAVSELADWAVFTITKRPLRERILISSAVSAPLDTIIFLALLPFEGTLNAVAVIVMVAVKMVGALIIFAGLRR